MDGFLFEYFIELNLVTALQVVVLGFIGGTLSGFIGSGGAFFMTPGMMNLGVPGWWPWEATSPTSSARP